MHHPRTQNLALLVVILAAALAHAPPSRACGGLLQPVTGTVSQSGQLGLIVVDQNKTSVVLTLDVPDASNAFGVLVPVPSQPTIDDQPVSTDALAALEERTRPVVGFKDEGDNSDGGLFSCGGVAGGAPQKGLGVDVGAPIAIGPVTAQYVSGADGNAVADWLTQQGFALPDGAQAIIDSYTNSGLSFVAFTRNESSAGAARVGVHFTVDGDHRAYALQMTKLGASQALAFTIFVATSDSLGVGPDSPYQAITVAQLDQDLAQSDYQGAVQKGVQAVGGKAFVVETSVLASTLFSDGVLGDLVPQGHTITRMSSVLDASDLDADVTFT
ncbi:MAG TPA: DUF2330 domain-containing protein, partial [Myxococcota bacterium]